MILFMDLPLLRLRPQQMVDVKSYRLSAVNFQPKNLLTRQRPVCRAVTACHNSYPGKEHPGPYFSEPGMRCCSPIELFG
jgi:hypothetical protein